MEFQFEVDKIFPGRITIIECTGNNELKIFRLDFENDTLNIEECWTCHNSAYSSRDAKFKIKKELEVVIDQLGHASAKAQGLHDAVTSFRKLINSNQKIYIMREINEPRFVIGLLKIGTKRLFISDDVGAHHEVDPLCLLDFYIHESKQRCGYGHELFNAMLQAEKISPLLLAIDRPSFKCLAFLEKHYGLKGPIVQANNFVIYPGFFQGRPVTRPPIFLYNKKGSLSTKSLPSQQNSSLSRKTMNEMEVLNSVQIPLNTQLRVSKQCSSSAESCLKWNVSDECGISHRKAVQNMNPGLCLQTNINSKQGCPSTAGKETAHLSKRNPSKNKQNWGVYDALHSYAVSEDVNGSNPNHCSLSPVSTESKFSQRSQDYLQSSWNVLGVKSTNHSFIQKKA